MAECLSSTYLHITSITSLSWVNHRIAYHSIRLHAAPCFRQEKWQCFSLQLTLTSPPSQVCLEFTFALQSAANAFTLRLIFVKRYGSVSLYNSPSQHLHHTCLDHKFVKRYGIVSLYNLPSHHLHHTCLHHKFVKNIAVFLSTTHLHIASLTSLSWVFLRIAFYSKHLHAAP